MTYLQHRVEKAVGSGDVDETRIVVNIGLV